MSGNSSLRNWGVALVLAALCAAPSFGQSGRRGRVTQMEIFNGSQRTVRYFGDNISPGEASALRDLERLENEQSYLNNLQTLKDQYVTSERLLETYRRQVQLELYGRQSTASSYGTVATNFGYGNGGFGYPSFGGFGVGGFGGFGGVSAVAGDSQSVTRSLADGVGPQGAIQQQMAGVLASQSTQEYASKVDRAYDMAMLRATASPTLRVAFQLPTTQESLRRDENIRRVSAESPLAAPVVVTLADGEKVFGKRLTEKGDFFVIETTTGTEEVRKSAVMRIQRGRGNGVVPAVD